MKTLIVEDDFTCRLLLQELLRAYGPSHVAASGAEALAAIQQAIDQGEHYDLVCLDIMMPGMSGHETLCELRAIEARSDLDMGRGAKVLMTTALGDGRNVIDAFKEQCDGYLTKPLDKARLMQLIESLRLPRAA